VLLDRPWDPLLEPNVPDVYVTDFGIASHVRTLGTRFTGQRGTPPYEAPVSDTNDVVSRPHTLT
jgi:hypothetical protein